MNPLTLQRTCVVCGTVFATVKSHAAYCGATCKRIVLLRKRHEAGRRRRHRRCPRCGNVFVAARADGVFCSSACRQAMHRIRHRAERLT
jgi:predicted nucleic acid-binding Zn ribbon protein